MDVISCVVLARCFRAVQHYVPKPYMDEIFHVPQAQQYCAGNFGHWDNKITTPPGIYLVGTYLGSFWNCDTIALRSINLFGLFVGAYMCSRFLDRQDVFGFLTSTPLLAFYANLFYTDVWATVLVLMGLALTYRKLRWLAAAVLLFSLLFRQTNIVWVVHAGVIAALDGYEPGAGDGLSRITTQFARVAKSILRPSLWLLWLPYALVVAAFSAFLVINGGIALGDKTNHTVSVNVAQLLYFALFSAFFSAPLSVYSGWTRQYLNGLMRLRHPPVLLRYVCQVALICIVISQFTVVHKFILADNRHYTFYLWRRLLHRPEHPVLAWIMAPVYHAALHWLLYAVPRLSLTELSFWLGTAAVLVPSPLMEPRYYGLPFVIWRIFLVQKRFTWVEFAYNVAINITTVYVFCTSKAHFMW